MILNGVTIKENKFETSGGSGNIQSIIDGDIETFRKVLISEDDTVTYEITLPQLSSVVSVDIKLHAYRHNQGKSSPRIILSCINENNEEFILYRNTDNDIYLDQKIYIYQNINSFKLCAEAVPDANNVIVAYFAYIEFYNFTIHSAPLGELSFKDGSGRTWRNLDWDEGYTPLQYCGTDGKVHNVLLVPYFSADGLPQYQSLASPVRLSLMEYYNDEGFIYKDFPSEKVRDYADQTFHYHKCDILAVAGRPI